MLNAPPPIDVPGGAAPSEPAAPRELADFTKDAKGIWHLREREESLQDLAAWAAPDCPAHIVGFIGDAEAGKSFLIQQLLQPASPNAGSDDDEEEAPEGDDTEDDDGDDDATRDAPPGGTRGVQVHTHEATLRNAPHPLLILDTEGLNANCSSDDISPAEYSLRIEKRPAISQLLPNVIYKSCRVIVYVWGADHQKPSQEASSKQAYQHCLEAIRPPVAPAVGADAAVANGAGGHGGPKPALLVVLNRQPVRKCVVASDAGDGYQDIGEDRCTKELLALEAHDVDRKLSQHFSCVKCIRVPLKESRGRFGRGETFSGAEVLPRAISTLFTTLTALLRTSVQRQAFPRVQLSELAWVRAFPQFLRCVNDAENRWDPTAPPRRDEIMHFNAAAIAERSLCVAHQLPRCSAGDCATAAECCLQHHIVCGEHNAPACARCMLRVSQPEERQAEERLERCCRRHHHH